MKCVGGDENIIINKLPFINDDNDSSIRTTPEYICLADWAELPPHSPAAVQRRFQRALELGAAAGAAAALAELLRQVGLVDWGARAAFYESDKEWYR